MIQDIINNEDLLKRLFKGGLLSHKIFFYRNLYLDYDANIRMGMGPQEATDRTSIKFDVSEMTVRRARRIMQPKEG